MYTQCPDCGTAFRVTADVLRQAAGKVRCGGCSNPFNALDYLSESMPEPQGEPESAHEEQVPELKAEVVETDAGLPKTISAEQSAALLKTLDELAGSDIRIEDTGVEWRVLDDDEAPADEEPLEVAEVETEAFDNPNNADLDEVLEEAPTAVDEFLTQTPEQVDSPEIFAADANGSAQTPVEELRFDDNTPLPEDFGYDDTGAVAQIDLDLTADEADSDPEIVETPEPTPSQPDIALSDPHEWTDILDEFEDLAEEAAAPLDEDLETLLDDAVDEAIEEADDVEEPVSIIDELAALEALGSDAAVAVEEPSLDEEPEELTSEAESENESEDVIAELEFADEPEELAQEQPQEILEELAAVEDELEELFDDEEPENDEIVAIDDDELADVDVLPAANDDASDEADEHYVPPLSEEEQTVNMMIDQELLAIAIEDEDGFASTMVIPEEMAEDAAAENPDGANGVDGSESAITLETIEDLQNDSGMETIVMEGEFVQSALDNEKREADVAAAAELQEAARLAEEETAATAGRKRYGMVAGLVGLALLLLLQMMHQSREALATIPAFNNTVGPIYRVLGSPLEPNWDVTGWRIESTRHNLQPAETDGGDVADAGDTAAAEKLVVYSRIGNSSETALPYPLISMSLTDRFEEPIGNQVLEPADYLSADLDPGQLVAPGNSFDAVIAVNSPSQDASNFRLRLCYRETDGQLRCKYDNFK